MSVGWLKLRRTEYKTFEKQKIMHQALFIILGYLVCWSWDAYFKPKGQVIGRPHRATILDRIMKNETANPLRPSPHKKIHAWNRAKDKMHHFPILVWRGGGINFPSILYKRRRQPGGILHINYSILCDEIPAPSSTRNTCEGKTTMTNQWGSAGSLVDLDQ